jgi:hypothetical protein
MLSLSRIEKTFGATRALKSVTLEAVGGPFLASPEKTALANRL